MSKLKIIVLFTSPESWNIAVDDGNCEFFFLYAFKPSVRPGKMPYYVILCSIAWVDTLDCDAKKSFCPCWLKPRGLMNSVWHQSCLLQLYSNYTKPGDPPLFQIQFYFYGCSTYLCLCLLEFVPFLFESFSDKELNVIDFRSSNFIEHW